MKTILLMLTTSMVLAAGGLAATTAVPALSPNSITSVAVDDPPSSGSLWERSSFGIEG